jgi:hypothetical protein
MRLGDEQKQDELRRKGGFELKLGEAGLTLVSRFGGAFTPLYREQVMREIRVVVARSLSDGSLSGRLSDPAIDTH